MYPFPSCHSANKSKVDTAVVAHVTKTAIASGASGAAVASAQVAAAHLVPIAMSTFGTVVQRVGTIHASEGVAATLQCFSALSIAMPVAVAGGGAYLVYEHKKQIQDVMTSWVVLSKQLKAKL